jgi:hypothetical protein
MRTKGREGGAARVLIKGARVNSSGWGRGEHLGERTGFRLQGPQEEGVRSLDSKRQRGWVLLSERVRREQLEERATRIKS